MRSYAFERCAKGFPCSRLMVFRSLKSCRCGAGCGRTHSHGETIGRER